MSIEVNGVSLPDIPSEVLEQYPYAVIVYISIPSLSVESYALMLSAEKFYFFESDASLNPQDGACDFWPYESTDGATWETAGLQENAATGLTMTNEDDMVIEVFAANYDILTADADGNATDTVYFAANFFVSDPNYFAPKSWFDGMARQVMRLTGTSDKLNTTEMLELAKGVEVGGGGSGGLEFESTASGCIPDYDHGYATSTLTLDGMFESTAN